MKFREILLLGLLLVAGLVIYQVQTGHWDLQFLWDEDFIGLGREFTYEVTEDFDTPLPSSIEIVNSHGWVVIEGTDRESAQLTFRKRVRRKDEAAAREIADRIRYFVERSEERLSFSTNREEFRKRNFETGFILTVPRGTSVTVNNSYGEVRLSDVREATVDNRHGSVALARIEDFASVDNSYEDVDVEYVGGGCRIITKHSEVKTFSIAGGLIIENRYGRIRIEDAGQSVEIRAEHTEIRGRRIPGTVDIETSYENITLGEVGETRIRARHSSVDADDVRGDLDVQTTHERVKATNVRGNLSVTGSNVAVSVRSVAGDKIAVETSYEDVDMAEFSAEVKITTRNGNVVLRPSSLAYPMSVEAEYGAIRFFWPEGEEAPIEARSRGGDVTWALDVEPTLRSSNGESVVKAFQNLTDKPPISLFSTYRDIRIEARPRQF